MDYVEFIQWGPFKTRYHRTRVDQAFKISLQKFLDRELTPQIANPITATNGTLKATFDDQRYCGSSSLVRDLFSLELILTGGEGDSKLNEDLAFDPITPSFSPRRGSSFQLWTPIKNRQRAEEQALIRETINQIRTNRLADPICPICGGRLQVVNDPLVFDIRCMRQRCFRHHADKVPKTKLKPTKSKKGRGPTDERILRRLCVELDRASNH